MTLRSASRAALALASLAALAAGCSSGPTTTSTTPDAPVAQAAQAASPAGSLAVTPSREEWRRAMSKTPVPKVGCFVASHPSTEWKEVPCATSTPAPLPPALSTTENVVGRGLGIEAGGTGGDFSAQVAASTISWAQGSFPVVSGVTSAGSYSLQLNTNTFSQGLGLCAGASNPSNCQYWEQFAYDTPSKSIYIQYWLRGYNSPTSQCPVTGWTYFGPTATSPGGCYASSAPKSVPDQPITNLNNIAITGATVLGLDIVTMWTGDGNLYAASNASVLGLAQSWTAAEFNAFGGTSSQVAFNPGSTLVVQTLTDSAVPTAAAPRCNPQGFTAETNNLAVVPGSCCAIGGIAPGIWFTESNVAGAPAEICPDTSSLVAGGGIAASQQFGIASSTDVFSVDASGAISVTWAGGAWSLPTRITGAQFPPGAPIAVSQQFGTSTPQTDVFAVDSRGNLDVTWVAGSGNWQGPSAIATPAEQVGTPFTFKPGSHIAVSNQFGYPDQTDVFIVDSAGNLTVTWVTGNGGWQSAEITSGGRFPPGAALAASQQFGFNQTDVFLVDNQGKLNVVWSLYGFDNGLWQPRPGQPPALLGDGGTFDVGTYVAASEQFGVAAGHQTDVFAVDASGNLNVAWSLNGGAFNLGPISAGGKILGEYTFRAGSPLAASQQFGVDATGQTDVFLVNESGYLNVMWVEGANSWQGPGQVGAAIPFLAAGGVNIAVSQQFGIPPQTDVFVINGSGNRTVSWAEQGNPFLGPSQIP